VARVNGQDITRVELADKLLKYYGDQGLNAIIQQAVVRQEAKALGVTATDQDLDRMENDFYSNAAAFRPGAPLEERKALWAHLLQSRGQTIETFRHDLEIEVLIEKLVDRRINITDEELQTEFKTLFKKGSPGENVKFEDVKAGLVDRLTKERAKALRPQVIAEIMKKADVERGDVILPGQ
jgi:foldase protein PrsA